MSLNWEAGKAEDSRARAGERRLSWADRVFYAAMFAAAVWILFALEVPRAH